MTIDQKIEIMDIQVDDFSLNRIKKNFHRKRRRIYMKRTGVVAASLIVLVSGILNLNLSYAERLSDIPLIGNLVQVLTFNRLVISDNADVDISIPKLEGLEDKALQEAINQLLMDRAMTVYDKAVEDIESSQHGFVSKIPVNVQQSFRLIEQTESYISFQVITFTVGASGYATSIIYNIDLDDNKQLTLDDIYPDIDALNALIIEDMTLRNQQGESFFIEDFKGVESDQNFYIKDGNLVIVFDEYEIAAGYMGMPEIEIGPIE
ncbi:DUF3298 and DUF4163 domain-containing protein [Acidaminobacter sp. JC074]|uniref:DUF3298 and DUF4163 domain-containing protein n=1 Tax=Acidaminobacter sp. JC074 TaxID=2530199 RepID=UPI001F1147AD|nr:DUF3298 and DUF4163 domain-containing protein [Acidaminobacter sp. JC074]MCH4887066.1 DUF3298 and DUF4163 domain-containing protein [Acidaminobacter sp. JC074]